MSLRLTPVIHKEVELFLINKKRLFDIVEEYGSPLNILFPDLIKINISDYQNVLENNLDQNRIYYAHKPNRSAELLKPVKESGIGVDVASYAELQNALAEGFDSKNIEATGPKNDAFIQEGVKAGIVFNIDSETELELVCAESKKNQKQTSIFVRLNGFTSEHTQLRWSETRFGIPVKNINRVIQKIVKEDEINLLGFSFHINVGGKTERLIAIENAIDCFLQARKAGLNPRYINIGGGFHINFLAHKKEWHDYVSALKQSVLGSGQRLSWNDSGLGYRNRQGVLEGGPVFGEFYRDLVKADELHDLLHEKLLSYDQPVKNILNDMMIGLVIEPGRSLLDQAGVTMAQVLDVKETSSGDQVVIVDMNRSNINSIDMSHLSDPILITDVFREEAFPAFIAGNLCLHSDIIYRHKTFFPQKPKRGDLLVFINTAGYNMNFAESQTCGQSVAKTLIVKKDEICSTQK